MSSNLIDRNMVTLSSLMQPGCTAVVTGASSGIGKAASMVFAAAGMNVWMVDIDATELTAAQEAVIQSIKKENGDVDVDQRIRMEIVNVADQNAVQLLAIKVFASGGLCHILMNNAGIGLGGGALTDIETVQKVMGVNTFGPIHGCLAFVPKMKESGEPGIIINTGSKQGITMPPGNLSYNMSKAALKVYTEGLEHELMKERTESNGRLRAVLLIPGWVNTSIMLKSKRAQAESAGQEFKLDEILFHEDKPHSGAWMPSQIITFLQQEVDMGRFYVVCPDNDVDRATDDLRMLWTIGDVIYDRPPLSRWHPDYKDKFTEFLVNKGKK